MRRRGGEVLHYPKVKTRMCGKAGPHKTPHMKTHTADTIWPSNSKSRIQPIVDVVDTYNIVKCHQQRPPAKGQEGKGYWWNIAWTWCSPTLHHNKNTTTIH